MCSAASCLALAATRCLWPKCQAAIEALRAHGNRGSAENRDGIDVDLETGAHILSREDSQPELANMNLSSGNRGSAENRDRS